MFVSVTGPSLDFLDDVLVAIVEALGYRLVTRLSAARSLLLSVVANGATWGLGVLLAG